MARARPRAAQLTVHGAEVSALHRVAGVLEIRVFNPTPRSTVVSFPGRAGWLVDLRGYPQEPFEGSFELRALRHRHRQAARRLSPAYGWR